MRPGIKHTIKENSTYFLTTTIVDWIDVFSRKALRDIVIDSLVYCQNHKGLNIFAYCIMTNHMHMIANCEEPFHLRDTIRDFKRHTSSEIYQWIMNNAESRKSWMKSLFERRGKAESKVQNVKVWQTGNHAIELRNERFTWTKVMYIHNNPVKAGWVRKPEDWMYSSATNYLGMESVLKNVICIPLPLSFRG